MGRQIVHYCVLWVANYRTLRTTALYCWKNCFDPHKISGVPHCFRTWHLSKTTSKSNNDSVQLKLDLRKDQNWIRKGRFIGTRVENGLGNPVVLNLYWCTHQFSIIRLLLSGTHLNLKKLNTCAPLYILCTTLSWFKKPSSSGLRN